MEWTSWGGGQITDNSSFKKAEISLIEWTA